MGREQSHSSIHDVISQNEGQARSDFNGQWTVELLTQLLNPNPTDEELFQ